MTRREIIDMFRVENPEITERVVTDVSLNDWCLIGDKIICAITRCIVSDFVISSVVSTSVYSTKYDLTTEEPKFYDIDEFPGGGISFDDDPLDKTTIAELDTESPTWRTRSAGTPKKWYRRGKYLYFDRPVETADLEIRIYAILVSDDFNNDDITPYNQLAHLEPFHNGINKYLQWQAKLKVGKEQDAAIAEKAFYDFANWMKKMIGGNKFGPITFIPKI